MDRLTEIIKLDARLADLELRLEQAKEMERYVLGNALLCPITGDTIEVGEWWMYLRKARQRVERLTNQIKRLHQPPRRKLGLIGRARLWLANQIAPAGSREVWA